MSLRCSPRGLSRGLLLLPLFLGACATQQATGPSVASQGAQHLAPKKARRPSPRSVALIVGIERYQSLSTATGAALDAWLFADYAEQSFGIPRANIRLLTNEHATLSTIRAELGELARSASSDGDVVFFFAGHGAPEPESKEGYLVPWEATPSFIKTQGLRVAEVYDALQKLPARHTYVFLDACFSGDGGRSVIEKGTRPIIDLKPVEQITRKLPRPPAPRPPAPPPAASSARKPAPALPARKPEPPPAASAEPPPAPAIADLLVLAAAGPEEVTGMASSGHGLFSHYLFEGLRGKADSNEDDEITWDELTNYTIQQVKNEANRQNRRQRPRAQAAGGSLAVLRIDPLVEGPISPCPESICLPPQVPEPSVAPKVLVGAGVALSVAGAVVLGLSFADAQEADEANSKVKSTLGQTINTKHQEDYNDAVDRANAKQLWGGILLGLGAVSAGYGGYLWWKQPTADKAGLQLRLGPGLAGVGWGREW